MPKSSTHPFDTIESALEFMVLLECATLEARDELRLTLEKVNSAQPYAKAAGLALFKVNTLASHIQKSRRLLNDLCMIRRLADGLFKGSESPQELNPESREYAVRAMAD